jgi:protein Tex
MADISARLVREFKIKPQQVESTIKLVDEGNTIPFIARYRKEMTGSLDDQVLRELYDRLVYLRSLEARREEVRRFIEEQGKLTEEIASALAKADSLTELEDIYRPFRPKRRTRASIAREKGLGPLADILLLQDPKKAPETEALPFVSAEKGVNDVAEALQGAQDIIAEQISDNAEHRKFIRELTQREGFLAITAKKEEDSPYRMYYGFREQVSRIAPHRVSALDRGEREGFLQVKLEAPETIIVDILKRKTIKNQSLSARCVEAAVEDSYSRLIQPSIETEVRNALSDTASEKAIRVFSQNLKGLLMQPPVKASAVLAVDPAYRTGCKLAVVDGIGNVLYTGVIYPTPPQSKLEESAKTVKALIEKFNVDLVAIGNGTASRESEKFIADLLKTLDKKVYYVIVSEAGASVYSASKLAAEEFPEFDVSLRSAVSIARRLQDPLAELVKIDPKAIGVGQYQHDVNQKRLDEALGGVVEDCVNSVGVDVNTASPALLSHVAGINATVANNIVAFRAEAGRIRFRKELLKVKKLGAKAFEQCAGFLRIPGGADILDNTGVHPESYEAAGKLLQLTGYSLKDVAEHRLTGIEAEVKTRGFDKVAGQVGVGIPTLMDILNELMKPGRDPRDEMPKPILSSDVLEMKDLVPGMTLNGTVRNVADFGAFVDIGVHQDGLVHVSELADKFVKNPLEFVKVGDVVKVKVLSVDVPRKRISLSMKGLNG